MKLYKFIFFLSLLFFNWYCFWYQHDWFLKYQEWEEWIKFECEERCVITLWERKNLELLTLNWTITWRGVFIVTSKNWGRDWLLYRDELFPYKKPYIYFDNYEKLLYGVPRDKDLLIEFLWNIKWNLNVNLISYSFLQKILKSRREFWEMETFNYGGMNFRNWVSIWWHNIVEYGYIFFILAVISILIISLIFRKLKKEKIFKLIFYVWLCMFLFIWFRNIITWTVLLKQWLSWFRDNYNLFQLKDYIWFVVKVRNKLHLDDFEKNDCKIFIKSDKLLYNWAVDLHWEYFFEPCERVYSSDLADYVLYAGVEIEAEDYGKDVLVEYNGRYLLDNRMK